MKGTVIDIPGVVVNVSTIHLENSTDVSSVIEIKDEKGNYVRVSVCYGKICLIKSEVK
jgi:hypothetical protein